MARTKEDYGQHMSNSFLLELDTTPPQINIICPPRTIPNNTLEIQIQSNENLGDWQEIFIIDNNNVKHDLILSKINSKTYLGYIDFSEYPIGLAKIHAILKDEVNNASDIAIHNLYIGYLQNKVDCYIMAHERAINIAGTERIVDITSR
jgi:hypothetical protein